MEGKISTEIKICPVCEGTHTRRWGSVYCGEKCRRKAEYQRLKPQIYAYHREHKAQIKEKQAEWAAANPEKVKATRLRGRPKRLAALKVWKANNKEHIKAYKKVNAKKNYNPERAAIKRAAQFKANPEKVRAWKRKWAHNNKAKLLAKTRRRQCAQVNATPSWLTKEHDAEIVEIYKQCRTLTQETGIKHEVDHIVPLQGKGVRGLHVPWNLQILTKEQNRAKRAKYDCDMVAAA